MNIWILVKNLDFLLVSDIAPVFTFTVVHFVSRLAPPVGGAYFCTDQWQCNNLYHVFKVLKTSTVCCLKTNCLISFKLAVFIADTHRCLHVNFLSNWLSFKIAENIIRLSKQRCVCVPWTHRNTMHLEFLKNIKW